jgi:hypothetical protein
MSIVQTTNFGILLNSFNRPSPPQGEAESPDAVILRALRDGIMPLADLVAKTDLSRFSCVEAVNRLLERRKVEILDQTGGDQRKFIRLAGL